MPGNPPAFEASRAKSQPPRNRHSMKQTLTRFLFFSALFALSAVADADDKTPPPAATQDAGSSVCPKKLLFSGSGDITDTWGKLHFGVTPVRVIRECKPFDFTFGGCCPLTDGSWEVFGQKMTEMTPGDEPGQRIMAWKLIRATTRDGATLENEETVFEQSAAWTDHFAIAKKRRLGRIPCRSNSRWTRPVSPTRPFSVQTAGGGGSIRAIRSSTTAIP